MNPATPGLRFLCLGDPDTVRGFQLAGVEGEVASTPEALADAFSRRVGDPGIGVILIPARLAARIRTALDRHRLHALCPVVAEIPEPAGTPDAPPGLRRQVQAAAGFSLEWREPPTPGPDALPRPPLS